MNRHSVVSTTRRFLALALTAGVTWPAIASPQQDQTAPPSQLPAPQADEAIEWKTGWNYGVRGALGFSSAESIDPGFGALGFAVLPITTDLELEGEVGYLSARTRPNELPEGRLVVFPLRATLRVQLYRFSAAKPYVGGGVGVYFNRFTIDQSVVDAAAEQDFALDVNIDPNVGFHAAGGIEWQSGRIHYGFDVKYVFAQATATGTAVQVEIEQLVRDTAEIDLNGLWIAGGLRFSF